MRKTKAIDTDKTTYVVRELTPNEIDALFDQAKGKEPSIVDEILDIHLLDTVLLGGMLGVDPARCGEIIGGLTQSEYLPIIEAAKELNPDFFALARRLVERAGRVEGLAEIKEMLAKLSESASPSLLPLGTLTPTTTD